MKRIDQSQICYELLQKILQEAFQIDTLFFTPPYEDFSRIDRGMRNLMWQDFLISDNSTVPSAEQPDKRLMTVRSNLGFYNIIFYLTLEEHPDFISVGPFRAEEFTLTYFPQLVKDMRLPATTLSVLKHFYEGLPYVQLDSVTNIVKHVIAAYFPEFTDIASYHAEFSNQNHAIEVDSDMLLDSSAAFAQSYKDNLFRFLSALKNGDSDIAQQHLKTFLQETRFLSAQNLTECRKNLLTLNDYCQLTLLSTPVHPGHTLKTYTTFTWKINSSGSLDTLAAIPNDLCHRYCLLVKNYAFTEYSQTIRAVINYIYLHVDEPLSSSQLAKHFHKNVTSLSSGFSREVGMSITDFIHQARINEAIRYFNTTKMSVSEVALAVGFQDFTYFSRLFRKQIGCSPREYKKSIL